MKKKSKYFFSILLLLCFTIDCQNNKNNGNESEAKRMPENELIAKKIRLFLTL